MKSLSAILTAEPLETLVSLADWWAAEQPQDSDTETRQRLERAMRDTIGARFVWERLDHDERRVLFVVVGPSARNWCPLDQLAERSHLDEEPARAALTRLEARRIVSIETAKVQGAELVGQRATFYGYTLPRNLQAPVEEKPVAYVPTELATALYTAGRELFVPIADRSTKTLDDLLAPYRQGDLDQIGRRFGLTLQAYYSRAEVRAAMAQNLSQADAVRYALARLDEPLREAYEWLRLRGGAAPMTALRALLKGDEANLSNALHTLEEYALVFDTFHDGERVVFIPRETLANLQKAEERAPVQVGLRQLPTPSAVKPADTAFLWDVAVLIAAAYHQDVELTRSGSLPKRAALRLLPQLVDERARAAEDVALDYVELLKQEAVELGLVLAPPSTAKTRGKLAPGPKLESWSRHDLVMQARRFFRRWPTDRYWADVPGADYREWLTFYLETQLARETVAALLKQCDPGVWYSLASFRATLQGDDPYILRPSQRNAGEAGFKLADDLRQQWETTDGEIITGIFRSTLYELGIVALGYEGEDAPLAGEDRNPTSFMLTELGAEALHSDLSASMQPASRSLVVQPNFQVLLMEPYVPALYWLARFAALEQIGRVSRFTFTRDALQHGLAAGGSIDEVVAFLERHCQKTLPQNVLFTLRDWARQVTHIEAAPLGTMEAHVLQVVDERTAAKLVSSPKLRAFRLRLAGPRAVAVPPEISLRDLRHALERLGYAKFLSGIEEVMAAAASLQAGAPTRRPKLSAATGA